MFTHRKESSAADITLVSSGSARSSNSPFHSPGFSIIMRTGGRISGIIVKEEVEVPQKQAYSDCRSHHRGSHVVTNLGHHSALYLSARDHVSHQVLLSIFVLDSINVLNTSPTMSKTTQLTASKQISLPLRLSPHITLHLQTTRLETSTRSFLTITNPSASGSLSCLGSFVYAMPSVSILSFLVLRYL